MKTDAVPGDLQERSRSSVSSDVVGTWKVDMKAWANGEPNPEIKSMFEKDQLFYRVRVLGQGNRSVEAFKIAGQSEFPNSHFVSVIDRALPKKGAEKESTFISVAEPYSNRSFVQAAVDLFPNQRGVALPRGVKVTCAIPGGSETQVDVHLFSDGKQKAATKGISVVGSYAFYRETQGAPTAWLLMGNTSFLAAPSQGSARLETPALTIDLKPDVFQGTVSAVNWKSGEIIVKGEIPIQASGRTVTLRTPGGRVTTYNVTSAQYDAASRTSRVTLQNLNPVGVCDVKTIDSQAGLIQTGQQPRFGNLFPHSELEFWPFLSGIWLVDEARTQQTLLASYGPIEGHVGPWFTLANKDDVGKLADSPGRNYGPLGEKEHLIFLYDVGVGDSIYFVPSVSVKRKPDGTYEVKSTGHEQLKFRGKWKPVQ